MSNNGTVLMLMDNVVFRKVLPEQIQMAIAAQSTPEDDAWMIEESCMFLFDQPSILKQEFCPKDGHMNHMKLVQVPNSYCGQVGLGEK